jgi:hypothetical protein
VQIAFVLHAVLLASAIIKKIWVDLRERKGLFFTAKSMFKIVAAHESNNFCG